MWPEMSANSKLELLHNFVLVSLGPGWQVQLPPRQQPSLGSLIVVVKVAGLQEQQETVKSHESPPSPRVHPARAGGL